MKCLTPTTGSQTAWRLGLCLLVSTPLAAAEPDLLGRWWWHVFETPAEVRFSGGQLVGGNDFGMFVGAEEFFPTATGTRFQNLTAGEEEERGKVTVTDSLVVRQEFDQGGENRLHANQALDVMIGASVLGEAGSEFASLEILLRQPTAPFTIADLAGQWDLGYFDVPQTVSAPSLTPGSTLQGGGSFDLGTDRLTLAPSGLLTFTATGESLGALVLMQGLPVFVGGDRQRAFFVNRGLDVLLSLQGDQTDDSFPLPIHNLTLLLRRPDKVTVADVVGRWHVADLYTPRRLQVGAGPVVQGGKDFGAESFSVTFFPDGRLVNEGGEVQAWSLTPDGLVQIGDAISGSKFAVNRSKTVAAAVSAQDDNLLTLAVKYSDETGATMPPTLSLALDAGQWRLTWSGGVLESAPTPSGPWNLVTGATSPRTLNADGDREFFRVRGE